MSFSVAAGGRGKQALWRKAFLELCPRVWINVTAKDLPSLEANRWNGEVFGGQG